MATIAGATPPVTTSAKLSSCTPIGPATPSFRAAHPSSTSQNIASAHTTATICNPRASAPVGQGSCLHNTIWSVQSATKASPKNDPDAAAQHTTTPPSKLPRVNALGTHFHVFMSQI